MEFNQTDIDHIASALNAKAKRMGPNYRLTFENEEASRKISLEIYPNTQIGTARGNLIIVYASSAFLQLQFCTGYVISKMLGEVTFIARHEGRVSGLIVERYSDVIAIEVFSSSARPAARCTPTSMSRCCPAISPSSARK